MKKLLKTLWTWVSQLWNNLDAKTKKYAPIAINAVEGLKKVMDSPVDDIVAEVLKAIIPGTVDDIIIDRTRTVIEQWIPRVLMELQLVDGIANISTPQEQLKEILKRLKVSSDETQKFYLHGFAVLILEKISDGKLTWSESVIIAEYAFKHRAQLGITK